MSDFLEEEIQALKNVCERKILAETLGAGSDSYRFQVEITLALLNSEWELENPPENFLGCIEKRDIVRWYDDGSMDLEISIYCGLGRTVVIAVSGSSSTDTFLFQGTAVIVGLSADRQRRTIQAV